MFPRSKDETVYENEVNVIFVANKCEKTEVKNKTTPRTRVKAFSGFSTSLYTGELT